MNLAINGSTLSMALRSLQASLDDMIDNNSAKAVEETIHNCAIGAAIAGVGSGWLPGAGSTACVVAMTGIIWTMYFRINSELHIKLSKSILKTLASAIVANISMNAGMLILSLAASTVLSFIPGIGTAGAMAIDGIIGYIMTYIAAIVYLKVLTKAFKAKADISQMSKQQIKDMASGAVQQTDIKAATKEAKAAYKEDKKTGKLTQENAVEELDENA